MLSKPHSPIKVISPEWLVECLKEKRIVEEAHFIVDISIPKKLLNSSATSKVDEEEKKDRVVKLEDIMEDVYAVKFGKERAGKKRPYLEMANETEDKGVKKKSQTLSEAPTKSKAESHLSYRSKSFKDGEEVLSEDSYLF